MKYRRYEEWLLLQIDETYDLKTVEEFLDDFAIENAKDEWINGKILLNRNPVEKGTILRAGDTLQIKAFLKEEVDFEPAAEMP